jgi:hypothetical protein
MGVWLSYESNVTLLSNGQVIGMMITNGTGYAKDDFGKTKYSIILTNRKTAIPLRVAVFLYYLCFYLFSKYARTFFSIRSLIFEISAFMNFHKFFIQFNISF